MSVAPVLSVLKNGQEIRALSVEGDVVLGRGANCGLRLDDRAISRQHALFRSTPSGVEVMRKSDFAPLLVNGVDCTSAILREGDVVQVGPYRLRLTDPHAAERRAANLAGPSAPAGASAKVAPESPASTLAPSLALQTSAQDATVLAETGGAEGGLLEIDGDPRSEEPATTAQAGGEGSDAAALFGLESGPGELDLDVGAGAVASSSGVPEIPEMGGESGVQSAITHRVVRAEEDGPTLVVSPKKILKVGLILESGAANVTHFELDKDEISLGRDKSCDIVLNDKKSSRRHAIVVRAGLRFVVKDLASANGIFVNGSPVKEQELFHGDKIRIGTTVIEFTAVSPEYQRREKNFMKLPEEPAAQEVEEQGSGQAFHAQPDPFQAQAAPPIAMPVHTTVDPQFAQSALGMPSPGGFGQQNFGAIPGMLPGTETGLPPPLKPAANGSIFDKFRALPPIRKAMWVIIILGIMFELDLLPLEELGININPKPKTAQKPGPVATLKTGPSATASMTPDAAYLALSAENKKFVDAQYELAFTLLKNKEYDKTIFEVQKIFHYVPDYKNAREIERYAIDGKRKLEAFEEEQRKKAAEEKLRKEVEEFVAKASEKMKAKKFDEARMIFPEILSREPENKQVGIWKSEIEAYETELAQKAKIEEVRKQVNEYAWKEFRAAEAIAANGHCKSAFDAYAKVIQIASSDTRPQAKARAGIARCRALIRDQLEPVLKEASLKEQSGEFKPAYELYRKATMIDEDSVEGFKGMKRIRSALEMHAKETYTEAVLAESYSDFALARKKYRETMEIAPTDDLYYERAQRKLSRWTGKFGDDGDGSGGRATASDHSAAAPAGAPTMDPATGSEPPPGGP